MQIDSKTNCQCLQNLLFSFVITYGWIKLNCHWVLINIRLCRLLEVKLPSLSAIVYISMPSQKRVKKKDAGILFVSY